MNPIEIHLNHDTKRWEFRDGAKVLVSFAYAGQGYFADGGQPLGARWDDAKAKALEMAEKRRERMILESAS